MKAIHAVVGGRVQGVGFRYSTQLQAFRLGLVGWVRNTPAGDVEVFAQGPKAAVDALAAWLARGPRGARVTEAVIESREPDVSLDSFSVRF